MTEEVQRQELLKSIREEYVQNHDRIFFFSQRTLLINEETENCKN